MDGGALLLAAVGLGAASVASGTSTPAQDAAASEEAVDPATQWPRWRGPLDTGVAPHGDPPLTWSEEENVRWRAPVPGRGHSSPIVWDGTVFVTTAVPVGEPLPEPLPDDAPGAHDNFRVTHRQSFELHAFDAATGEPRWRKALREELPHMGAHVTAGFASPSPVTDGEVVVASFGSYGLYGLDLDGAQLWERDLGDMRPKHGHGEGGSPTLFDGVLVVPWDHEGDSFVVALDAASGEELWRAEREEPTSWATPIVTVVDGRPLAVVSGTRAVRAYDLKDGAVVWSCGGLSNNVVASPVVHDGLLIAGSSYEKQAMIAVRLAGAAGDLTRSEHLVWVRRRATPYVPSPLLLDGWLYFMHHYQGFLSRVEARSGEEPERAFRLDLGNVYASPVAAAGRVYLTDLDGATLVFRPGDETLGLARNELNDSFSASAAIVGDALYLRGEQTLYCIGE